MKPWIRHKVYKDTVESKELSQARALAGFSALSFELQGHRWRYRMTGFDDTGEYDEIERPNPDYQEAPPEPAQTLRDYFARQALAAVPPDWWNKPSELAEYCFNAADAMISARKGGPQS